MLKVFAGSASAMRRTNSNSLLGDLKSTWRCVVMDKA